MGETLARNWENPGSSFSTAKLDIKNPLSKSIHSYRKVRKNCEFAVSVNVLTPDI